MRVSLTEEELTGLAKLMRYADGPRLAFAAATGFRSMDGKVAEKCLEEVSAVYVAHGLDRVPHSTGSVHELRERLASKIVAVLPERYDTPEAKLRVLPPPSEPVAVVAAPPSSAEARERLASFFSGATAAPQEELLVLLRALFPLRQGDVGGLVRLVSSKRNELALTVRQSGAPLERLLPCTDALIVELVYACTRIHGDLVSSVVDEVRGLLEMRRLGPLGGLEETVQLQSPPEGWRADAPWILFTGTQLEFAEGAQINGKLTTFGGRTLGTNAAWSRLGALRDRRGTLKRGDDCLWIHGGKPVAALFWGHRLSDGGCVLRLSSLSYTVVAVDEVRGNYEFMTRQCDEFKACKRVVLGEGVAAFARAASIALALLDVSTEAQRDEVDKCFYGAPSIVSEVGTVDESLKPMLSLLMEQFARFRTPWERFESCAGERARLDHFARRVFSAVGGEQAVVWVNFLAIIIRCAFYVNVAARDDSEKETTKYGEKLSELVFWAVSCFRCIVRVHRKRDKDDADYFLQRTSGLGLWIHTYLEAARGVRSASLFSEPPVQRACPGCHSGFLAETFKTFKCSSCAFVRKRCQCIKRRCPGTEECSRSGCWYMCKRLLQAGAADSADATQRLLPFLVLRSVQLETPGLPKLPMDIVRMIARMALL
jgi:hypothetical protein